MHSRFLSLALMALCCCGDDAPTAKQQPAPPRDAAADTPSDTNPAPKVAISFATFNVHQFFDTTCDSGQCGAGDFEMQLTQAQFDAKADAIASAIRGMKLTAISVQEIETAISLQALTQRLSDVYPAAVFGETGTAGSLDVAVLGSGPVIEIRKHRGVPITRPDGTSTTFTRELLEVHMDQGNGLRLVVFSAHFRSKNEDDPGRRQAEARATRDYVVATATEFPDAVVLLGGDLNDTPGSDAINDIESSPDLLRVASDRPIDEVSTYLFGGQLFAIDHIFLGVQTRGGYMPASAEAVRDAPNQGLAGSDHAALRADFYLK